jgi:hypothetical protein
VKKLLPGTLFKLKGSLKPITYIVLHEVPLSEYQAQSFSYRIRLLNSEGAQHDMYFCDDLRDLEILSLPGVPA